MEGRAIQCEQLGAVLRRHCPFTGVHVFGADDARLCVLSMLSERKLPHVMVDCKELATERYAPLAMSWCGLGSVTLADALSVVL
jgi:hypothetical protein